MKSSTQSLFVCDFVSFWFIVNADITQSLWCALSVTFLPYVKESLLRSINMLNKSRFRLQLHHLKDQTMCLQASCPTSWRCVFASLKLYEWLHVRESTCLCFIRVVILASVSIVCSSPQYAFDVLICTISLLCKLVIVFSKHINRNIVNMTSETPSRSNQVKWGDILYSTPSRERKRVWV